MAKSPTTNETVFYDQHLSNGLQIVGQPMPDFKNRQLSHFTCELVRVTSLISVLQVSPTFWSTWFLRAQKRLTGKR